ncbi:hypothetical protein [Pseudonocardia abyssalis]|uniref:Uncharacterized protein n=1 Tax=Pseudonocardia abyssalis TaxID=2792008 RepID=A0ABS6UMC5_9PSEU|nr:hypothetical protein [Pseudonocardia abyssalis]MBW0115605.1 hypothetical protein [Pseudonocardia abyssalis]MBW0133352.1 hypothetical protein [Pseudonocardia abyssalis]
MLAPLIGVHGLVLPAVPAVLPARIEARRRLRIVGTAVAAVGVAVAVLLAHASTARPLGALPPLALGVLGLCAAALLGSWAVTLRSAAV